MEISDQLRDLKQSLDALHRTREGRAPRKAGRFASYVERAITNPGTTTNPGWAAELVAIDLVELLAAGTPPSIFTQLREIGLGLSLVGIGGASIPVPVPSATPLSNWIAEGAPVPDVAASFQNASIRPRKASCLSVVTAELKKRSGVDIQRVLANLLSSDLRRLIDRSLLDDQPASAARPSGILHGLTPISPAASLLGTIQALVAELFEAGGTAPVLIMHPVRALDLADLANPAALPPVLTTPEIPAKRLIAVDAPSFIGSLGDPVVSVSKNAIVHEEDTAPAPIVAGGGTVMASPVRSLWQTDCTGILTEFEASWTVAGARAASADLA